jgi:hypothetical protein
VAERMERDGLDPVDAAIVRLVLDGVWLGRLGGFPEPDPARLAALGSRLQALASPPRGLEPARPGPRPGP